MSDWPPLSNDRFSSSSSSPFSYTSPEHLSPTVRSIVQPNGIGYYLGIRYFEIRQFSIYIFIIIGCSVGNGVNSVHHRFHSESEDSNYATPAGSLQHI